MVQALKAWYVCVDSLSPSLVFLTLSSQWPYSYDSCDVGTLPNQTYPDTSTPLAAVENGDPSHDNMLVCHVHFCLCQQYVPMSFLIVIPSWSTFIGMHVPRRVASWSCARKWCFCWSVFPRNRYIWSYNHRWHGRGMGLLMRAWPPSVLIVFQVSQSAQWAPFNVCAHSCSSIKTRPDWRLVRPSISGWILQLIFKSTIQPRRFWTLTLVVGTSNL